MPGHRHPIDSEHRHWQPVPPSFAVGMIGALRQDGALDLVLELAGQGGMSRTIGTLARMAALRSVIASGRIRAWKEIPAFDGPSFGPAGGAVPHDVLAPLYRAHAQRIGVDTGERVEVTGTGPNPASPATAMVPLSSTGQVLRDVMNDTCPANNHRSEGVGTARPEVLRWLRDVDGRLEIFEQEEVLGRYGGGGFLATTTRVATLPMGTHLYRYYDPNRKPAIGNKGGWWTTEVVAGDPRQTLALPDQPYANAATHLVHAQLGEPIIGLTGLGAPRCSNKPGGPQQWYLSKPDRFTKKVLRLPEDISSYLPDDPVRK